MSAVEQRSGQYTELDPVDSRTPRAFSATHNDFYPQHCIHVESIMLHRNYMSVARRLHEGTAVWPHPPPLFDTQRVPRSRGSKAQNAIEITPQQLTERELREGPRCTPTLRLSLECEEADEETAGGTDSVEKKLTRNASVPRAVDGKREHDHRSLFSFSGSQSQHGAAVRKEFRASVPKGSRASSLELRPVNGAPAGITTRDIEIAKQSLANLGKKVESSSAKMNGESDYQKGKRLQKAMTGPLDKYLYHLRQRKDYKQIEAIAYVWDDVFPQFANNMKHRTIICENYAFVLNYQQRFGDVIDNLFKKQLSVRTNGGESVNYKALMMSPQLAESILFACGHLKDTESAVRLLEIMRLKSVRITKVAYFHLLNTLLKDEENVDLGLVLQLCEEVVHDLNDTVPLSLLPTVIKVAAEHGELDRAMNVYNHPIDAPMDSFTEFRFEICLQCLCNHGYISAMMEVYNNVMKSSTATRGLKERLSKCLLLKCLKDRKAEHHEAVAEVALDILEIMEEHQIETNHHTVYPLIRTLLLAKYITTGDDLIALFSKYSHVIELNSFSICEAVIACVFCKDVQLVDELFVHALDNNIPIKYAALEKVVSFYYKLGMLGDLEKVADIIRALRLNKHIPLGIAVTEIGMASNIRLGRYEEVIHLFEDFSAMDGDRKRILKRRIMLKSALKAYAALNRLDESNAIKVLLGNSYGNVLKRASGSTDGVEDNGDDDEDFSDFFTESIDKKIDDRKP
ncbi:hypothetical protein FI667_g13999, partial [Globisporangium splendens]